MPGASEETNLVALALFIFSFSFKKISAYSWPTNWHFFHPLWVFLDQFALISHNRLHKSLAKFPRIQTAKQALFLLFLLFLYLVKLLMCEKVQFYTHKLSH